MIKRNFKLAAVLVLSAMVGAAALTAGSSDALARTCWRCVGGWCCN